MQVRKRLKIQVGEYDWQSLAGFVRLFVFGLGVIVAIGVFGGTRIDGIDPRTVADQYRKSIWFFEHLPEWVLVIIGAVFNLHSLRYMIAPLIASIAIIIASAYYVQDVYAIKNFMDALRYVTASMFGSEYPTIRIDKGEKQLVKNEFNLIDQIGGPGFVVIEPGNAAMFRRLRGPSQASVSEVFFLAPFETIASTVNLDEQQGVKEEISATTRDGIKVKVKDIQYRFRIKQLTNKDGTPLHRSPENPYPVSEDAIRDMTFNLQVIEDIKKVEVKDPKSGKDDKDSKTFREEKEVKLETWQASIERAVVGTISDYIISKNLDYLTAPRTNDYSARIELNSKLFEDDIRKRLAGLGAELLWVDVGHIEIEDESVDDLRTNVWSVDWAGDAAEARAYGEAIQQAYQELGRAEAQADLIMSIAGALSDANLTGDAVENVRRLLLVRTAQVLDALSEKTNHPRLEAKIEDKKEEKEEEKKEVKKEEKK